MGHDKNEVIAMVWLGYALIASGIVLAAAKYFLW